ncbi:MAG: hypothetical protein QME58_04095 [Bacteroidota bacterium]|nr:hypothetical protein [Bacteroidota bacterium]
MKVTYENGIKIVGEKTFDIEIKKGDIKQIIYTNIDGVGNCAYVVAENWIDRVTPNSSFDTVHVGTLKPKDGSKIFTHDGAIYVSSDGTLFATTNTMILIMKTNTVIQRKYADRFGDGFPRLTRATIREGNGSDVVDVRDDEFAGFKIQVLRTGEMEMKKDEVAAIFN